ncbi:hypothetical protein MATL_G00161040 [Megalops atlanticus]|uniref:Uncharacterized protein n=1 Tax=Megalops atlanticus TaxID=7932 RepID=A0A9D3PR12_MEGAT|nr:hypothetical protein MATL_G00161040 [Megalops atlanticus]
MMDMHTTKTPGHQDTLQICLSVTFSLSLSLSLYQTHTHTHTHTCTCIYIYTHVSFCSPTRMPPVCLPQYLDQMVVSGAVVTYTLDHSCSAGASAHILHQLRLTGHMTSEQETLLPHAHHRHDVYGDFCLIFHTYNTVYYI